MGTYKKNVVVHVRVPLWNCGFNSYIYIYVWYGFGDVIPYLHSNWNLWDAPLCPAVENSKYGSLSRALNLLWRCGQSMGGPLLVHGI